MDVIITILRESIFIKYVQQNTSAIYSLNPTANNLNKPITGKKRKLKNSNDASNLVSKMISDYYSSDVLNKVNVFTEQNEATVPVDDIDDIKLNVSLDCAIVQVEDQLESVQCQFSFIVNENNGYSDDTIIVRVDSDQLTVGELKRFLPRKYLSSQNIDIYFRIMCNADRIDSIGEITLNSSHFFSCMFISKIAQGYESSKRWTRNIDLFSYKYLFVPVNISNEHWVLIVMDIELKIVKYYDPYHNVDTLKNCEKCLEYLRCEGLERHCGEVNLSQWSIVGSLSTEPTQTNVYDCGVFLIVTAHYLWRRQQLTFGESYMESFRLKIANGILNQRPFN